MKLDKDLLALAMIIVAGALYYYVVLQSPIVFGDEGYYASIGRWMANTGMMPDYEPYYQTDVYHQPLTKFPLHFFFNAGAWLLLGELGIKLLVPIFSILSAAMIYAFLKKEGLPELGIASAFVLLMMPGMITYGVLDYVETMNVLMVICSLMFGYRAVNGRRLADTVMAGLFIGLALLTDLTSAFAVLVLLAYFLFSKQFGSWKNVLLLLVVAGVVFSPFLIRNFLLFGDFCYPLLPGECAPKIDVPISHAEDLSSGFIGGVAEIGTGMGLLKMGVLNYMNFALGWSVTVMLLFGVASLSNRRDKLSLMLAFWLLAFLALNVHQALFGARAEDIPRYSLFGFPAVALVAGLFMSDAYKWSVHKNRILAGFLILLFAVSFFAYGYEKLVTMTSVKAFAPGFFVGCDWIKANTPQDSLLFTIYAHHTAYQCDRANLGSGIPDKAEIQLTNNDTAYEHLKLHGFDYVFVQQFTVSQQSYYETITTDFLNYLETSPHFKKVYDHTATYGNTGVRLYKVL